MESILLEKNNVRNVDVLIFIYNVNLRGGTEIMALNLMKAMNSSNMQCRILSLVPYQGNNENILSFRQFALNQYLQIAESQVCKLFVPLKSLHVLRRLLSNVVDMIHPKVFINFTYDLLPATPRCNGITKMYGIFHWSALGYEQSIIQRIKQKSFFYRYSSMALFICKTREIHRCLHHLDNLIVLTQEGKKEALSFLPDIDGERIYVIPNFIPFDRLNSNVSSLNNKTAIFVGRLSVEKGCYRLLDIWERISIENPNWQLKIYGEGNEQAGMERIIEQRKLANIHFCGFKENIDSIYRNADLLLCTSDSEGFGLVLIEAMYYGVIPFSFDCPVSIE